MDQLICVSLSHTHYWYEVSMFKVPAVYAGAPVAIIRVSFLLFFFCLFRDVFFSEYYFVPLMIAVSSLNGEYLVRSFLPVPDCVFLPCDHGLDF